jgi:hypothetical protein
MYTVETTDCNELWHDLRRRRWEAERREECGCESMRTVSVVSRARMPLTRECTRARVDRCLPASSLLVPILLTEFPRLIRNDGISAGGMMVDATHCLLAATLARHSAYAGLVARTQYTSALSMLLHRSDYSRWYDRYTRGRLDCSGTVHGTPIASKLKRTTK